MTPPKLTANQRELARAAALRTRQERSRIKASVRQGRTALADVLQSPDPHVQGMRVRDVLLAVPRIGPIRCAQIMEQIGIAETRRVRGLSDRQREALASALAADSSRGNGVNP